MNARLALVQPEIKPEDALRDLLPRLAHLEREATAVRGLIDLERRRLARDRGVTFLRFEQVRSEFGR